MSSLSKFLVESLGWTIRTETCSEGAHPWNPKCYGALFDLVRGGWWFCLKTYISVYSASFLLGKGVPSVADLTNVLFDSFRSTLFLLSNMVAFLWFICKFRQILGFFTLPTMGLINGIIASYLAIFVENPKRRPVLALYITNLASETAFRHLVKYGYIRPVPCGDLIIFAMSIVGLLHKYRQNQLPPHITRALIFLFRWEDKSDIISSSVLKKMSPSIVRYITVMRNSFSSSPLCSHNYSCISRIGESFYTNFTFGLILSGILASLRQINTIFSRPAEAIKRILSLKNLRLPLFFGLLPSLYRASLCFINRYFCCKNDFSPAVSAAFSSLSLLVFRSVSIPLYVFWKTVEVYYLGFIGKGYLPKIKRGDVVLYAISTGFVLWSAVVEPETMRKAYWDFLCGVSGNKINLIRRTFACCESS